MKKIAEFQPAIVSRRDSPESLPAGELTAMFDRLATRARGIRRYPRTAPLRFRWCEFVEKKKTIDPAGSR